MMRALLAALAFLTVCPVPRRVNTDLKGLRDSLGWYPAVGLLLGLVNAGVFLLLQGTPVVAALAATAASFALTRALHADGLADASDALFAGGTPKDRLAIMRDPRHGTFGVLALVLDALARMVLLASAGGGAVLAVICAPVAGRWAMVYALSRAGYDPGGKLKAAAAGSGKRSMSWATVTAIAVSVPLARSGPAALVPYMLPLGVLLLAVPFYVRFVRKRLGTMPGDALGALNELSELLVIAVFFAVSR